MGKVKEKPQAGSEGEIIRATENYDPVCTFLPYIEKHSLQVDNTPSSWIRCKEFIYPFLCFPWRRRFIAGVAAVGHNLGRRDFSTQDSDYRFSNVQVES